MKNGNKGFDIFSETKNTKYFATPSDALNFVKEFIKHHKPKTKSVYKNYEIKKN